MNRLERVQRIATSGVDAFDVIRRQISGIRRTLELEPQSERLRQLHTELSAIFLNVQRLEPLIDETLYLHTYEDISTLIAQVSQLIDTTTTNDIGTSEVLIETTTETAGTLPIYEPQTTATKTRFKIDKTKLETLLSLGFSVRKIARDGLLGSVVHYNTIHNFMIKEGMPSQRERFTTKSDEELKTLIRNINIEFPNSGIREMMAHLKLLNPPVILQRTRCQRLLAEVDPIGAAIRWAQVIRRRQYKVPSPNSLWHIDSNHALVR